MPAPLRVNWIILRTCIEERLVYRADFALGSDARLSAGAGGDARTSNGPPAA